MHHSPRSKLPLAKCRTRALHGPYSFELSWPANSCRPYVKSSRTGDISHGNATFIHRRARLTRMACIGAWSSGTSTPGDFTLLTLTKRREVTDEEIELIEMRHEQALALMNLEELFAEGQLDSM